MPYEKRLAALVAQGYFPKELPPVFTTDSFGQHVNEILNDWRSSNIYRIRPAGRVPKSPKKKKNSYSYGLESYDLEIITKPKKGYERRNIHITHPIPQALLSYEISYNWNSVQKWLLRQRFSLDKIAISSAYRRSIRDINFEMHRAKKNFIGSICDVLIKTDISRFYPTIYTHSIPWAAYGKEKVKNNIKLYEGSLADRLDSLVRSCNRNQTIGIPIGPETSRIIAEVISSRIDSDFSFRMPTLDVKAVDRLQDDWFIGTRDVETAERALSAINIVYREYGLEINGSKTSVERVIGASDSEWISELGAFISHRPGALKGNRLREFLSLSLRLQARNQTDPVVNYSLAIIENNNFNPQDVEIIESFLLKSALISPMSMDRICRIMLNIQHRTQKISVLNVRDRFTLLAERNLERNNLYEVIWLLYTLRGLKIPINSTYISDKISEVDSSVIALILLDMKDRNAWLRKLPKAKWIAEILEERIKTDWIWLLAYEGIRNGWLADPKNVMASPFFSAMNSRGIIFYDKRRNIPLSTRVSRTEKLIRAKNLSDTLKFMQEIRGFEVDY